MSSAAPAPPADVAEAASGDRAFDFVQQLARDLSRDSLELPSFPDAMLRIQQVISSPAATTATVARAVQAEPVFTARLFRMANSVLLRRGEEAVSNLEAAINRLGFDLVKNLAVALATRQVMNAAKCPHHAAELAALWQHSVDTAALAFVLARDSGCAAPHDALLAGLLHDIGTAYIYARLEAEPALAADSEAVSWILDDWHATIGRAILEHWDFPDAIAQAVDDHETLERADGGRATLTDVLVVANVLARQDTPGHATPALHGLPSLARLGLAPEQAPETLAAARQEAELIKSALA